ncbi:hypothetical protein E4U55_007958 [Claviceps digitariae]|nr:hypothetical protein E4U55_007958 [Claviceps digitariae]
MSEILTDAQDWHVVNIHEVAVHIIGRISCRVFLGKELCRNEKWLQVSRDYALVLLDALNKMLVWPHPLRGIVSRFHPSSRRATSLIKEARECMAPVLERRQRERDSGNYVPYNDSMEWFEAAANGEKRDVVLEQLALSTAAVLTTTDLLTQTMGDLAVHQDFIEPLRREVTQCLEETGWNKMALNNMKLLDSCIKESQRLKPMSMLLMGRHAHADMTLLDGTFIPKGSLISISPEHLSNPAIYDNPSEWQGARFFNKRQEPGHEQTSQLAATGPDHLGFGFGQYACPGRHVAATELKMVLAHLVLKYDIRVHDRKPQIRIHGFTTLADQQVKVEVRRRTEEIDLSAL